MIKGNPVPLPKGRNLFFKRRKNKTSNSAGTTYIEAEISRVWDSERGFSRPKSVLIGKLCNDREGWMIPNANFFEVFPDAQTSQDALMDDMPLTRGIATEVKSADESSNTVDTAESNVQGAATKAKAQSKAQDVVEDKAQGAATKAKAKAKAESKAQDGAESKAEDGAESKAQDGVEGQALVLDKSNVLRIAARLKGVPVPLPKGRNLFFKRRKNKTSNSAGTTYIEAEISRVWDSERGFSRPKSVLIGKLCNDREGWMIPNANFFEVFPDAQTSQDSLMDDMPLTRGIATGGKSADESFNTEATAEDNVQGTATKAKAKAKAESNAQNGAESKAHGTVTKAKAKAKAESKAQDGAESKAQAGAEGQALVLDKSNVLRIAAKLKGVPVPLPKGRNLYFKRRKNKTSNSAGTTYIEAELSRVWDAERGFSRPKSVLIGKLCNDREGWMIPNANFFEVYPDVAASLIAKMGEQSLTPNGDIEVKIQEQDENKAQGTATKAKAKTKAKSKAQEDAAKAESKA